MLWNIALRFILLLIFGLDSNISTVILQHEEKELNQIITPSVTSGHLTDFMDDPHIVSVLNHCLGYYRCLGQKNILLDEMQYKNLKVSICSEDFLAHFYRKCL